MTRGVPTLVIAVRKNSFAAFTSRFWSRVKAPHFLEL
jgi:hypothetical protein